MQYLVPLAVRYRDKCPSFRGTDVVNIYGKKQHLRELKVGRTMSSKCSHSRAVLFTVATCT